MKTSWLTSTKQLRQLLMNNLSVGEFTIVVSNGVLTVKGADGSISFSPAEAARMVDLIALALQASNLPAVPPKLAYSPFSIAFDENEIMYLGRIDSKSVVQFTPKNGDDLILAIELGVKKLSDKLRIAGGPRAGVSSFNPKDPVINGR